jgi:thiosulfate sulfurtransferase
VQTTDSQFQHMNVEQLQQQLANNSETNNGNNCVVVDIRDATAFAASHIPGAIHLTNDSIGDFMREADLDTPTVVCCYHGISSQQAADFLISQDFTEVYSLDGGFEQWGNSYPNNVE